MSKKQNEHANAYTSEPSNIGLFNNDMFKAALEALSDEDKEKYKLIGEELYGKTDFVNSGIIPTNGSNSSELIAHVENQLMSGIHPSDMEDGEKLIMEDAYGDTWYIKWGYTKEDLDDIVTVKT